MTLEDFDANAGMDEPDRSEPADMGGGESSGPQDLLNGPEDSTEQTSESTGAVPLEDAMSDNTVAKHTVSESADKITLKADVKRGSDTRDQDKINVKVKGDNPEATAQKLAETLAALEAEGVADTLRETQPGESE